MPAPPSDTGIDADVVAHAARLAGLDIAPAQMAGVVANLRVMAAVAAALNEFALDEENESAAVFTPCSTPRPE
ncbi:MAG TPA: DUF4089 domain-containing protein [Burkholderiales bacterium]|nr:DUF4089 domain-containing protein [Burkholderiales bacterium]